MKTGRSKVTRWTAIERETFIDLIRSRKDALFVERRREVREAAWVEIFEDMKARFGDKFTDGDVDKMKKKWRNIRRGALKEAAFVGAVGGNDGDEGIDRDVSRRSPDRLEICEISCGDVAEKITCLPEISSIKREKIDETDEADGRNGNGSSAFVESARSARSAMRRCGDAIDGIIAHEIESGTDRSPKESSSVGERRTVRNDCGRRLDGLRHLLLKEIEFHRERLERSRASVDVFARWLAELEELRGSFV